MTIAYILTALAEAIMFFLIFDAFFDRRKTFPWWQYLIGVGLLAVMIRIVNMFLLFRFENAIGIILIATAISIYFFKASLVKRLFVSFLTCSVLIAAVEMLVLNMIMLIFDITAQEAISSISYLILGVIISKVLALAACYAIRVRRQLKLLELGWGYWCLFIALFLSAILASFMIFWMLNALNNPEYNMIAFISSVGLYVGTFLALYLYERAARQNQIIRYQEQSEQQMRSQLKHMDEMILKQNEILGIRHDMNNHLVALNGYLESRDIEGCQRYLAKITRHLNDADMVVNTGNSALDSIISMKKSLAESKGITFNTDLRIQKTLPFAPEDLCILIGNALDNSIEACERLPVEAEKMITLSLIQDSHTLFCEIVNTAPISRTNHFSTSKADKINHGFGLGNIRKTLEKYQLEPLIEQNGKYFIFSFVLFKN